MQAEEIVRKLEAILGEVVELLKKSEKPPQLFIEVDKIMATYRTLMLEVFLLEKNGED